MVIGNPMCAKISVLEEKATLELGGVPDLYDTCGRKPCANWYKQAVTANRFENRSFWGMEAGLRLVVDQANVFLVVFRKKIGKREVALKFHIFGKNYIREKLPSGKKKFIRRDRFGGV